MQDKTATYKLITDTNGKMRYQFFCDLSKSLEYTSAPIKKHNPDNLVKIWTSEAKKHFNHCNKCKKWVSTVMFNADVLECVACAPWEETPNYCPYCGKKVDGEIGNKCNGCGSDLKYEGVK